MRISRAILGGLFAAGAAVSAIAQSDEIHVVLPRDGIPSIDQPSFGPAADTQYFADEELMIGVVGEREARAYSTWQLDVHEIVNDVFEGRPIAVTW